MTVRCPWHVRQHQRGAAAIEFALLFVLFFVVFYALMSYAVAMLLQQSFQHAAEEGARSAIAVDALAYASDSAYHAGVEPQVRTTVGNSLSWLPQWVKDQVLGSSNGNVQLSWSGSTLTVSVVYASYASNTMMPALTFPAIGQVPRLPTDLKGRAVIDLP